MAGIDGKVLELLEELVQTSEGAQALSDALEREPKRFLRVLLGGKTREMYLDFEEITERTAQLFLTLNHITEALPARVGEYNSYGMEFLIVRIRE